MVATSVPLTMQNTYRLSTTPHEEGWLRPQVANHVCPVKIWDMSIANLVNHTSRTRAKLAQSEDRNHSEVSANLELKLQREHAREITLAIGSRELHRIVPQRGDSVATEQKPTSVLLGAHLIPVTCDSSIGTCSYQGQKVKRVFHRQTNPHLTRCSGCCQHSTRRD